MSHGVIGVTDLRSGDKQQLHLNDLVTVRQARGSLVYTVPHAGTLAPTDLVHAWSLDRRALADTDLHTEKLFDFEAGTKIVTDLNRYAANMNRPRWHGGSVERYDDEDALRTFLKGMEPSWTTPIPEEVKQRLLAVYDLYHDEVRRALHEGDSDEPTFLLACHSMNEFAAENTPDEGRRPDITIGTENGRSAPPRIVNAFVEVFERSPYSVRVDDPYAGGFTTRHYAAGCDGVVGIQVEVNKATYMDEDTFKYEKRRGEKVKAYVRSGVNKALSRLKKKKEE